MKLLVNKVINNLRLLIWGSSCKNVGFIEYLECVSLAETILRTAVFLVAMMCANAFPVTAISVEASLMNVFSSTGAPGWSTSVQTNVSSEFQY
jgi:hypothetical protein